MSDPEPVLTMGAKVEVLRSYATRYPRAVMVETGLWEGRGSGMQLLDLFERYVAIDKQAANIVRARKDLIEAPAAVDLHHGDSATVLPEVLSTIHCPALLWLDAHDMEWIDGAGSCPLLAEISALRSWPYLTRSVVLIDDVRYLDGPGWPTRDQVWAALEGEPFTVADDILRWLPCA